MLENCIPITTEIKNLANQLEGETPLTVATLIGAWQTDNNKIGEFPTIEVLKKYRDLLRNGVDNKVTPTTKTSEITYTPIGKAKQTYTIETDTEGAIHIYNKQGTEVFKDNSKDRRKILANYAITQGDAVVVTERDIKYVVFKNGTIISSLTGNETYADSNHGIGKAIREKAQEKFKQKNNTSISSSTSVQKPIGIKRGVSELFESDSELANAVYEALGFGKESNNIEILTSNYTRQSVQNDVDSLYLFTDNAQRTSRPSANEENVDKNSWYYKKYKSQTNKPIHFGSTSNPTSAVIRGLNNAYPISTMSAYGTNWTDSNFELFKQTIDDEIAQIKKDLSKFSKVKIGDFRIGQGGRFAKLPQQHQQYLDNKLLEIGIDNTGNKPKIINSPITPKQKQQAQQWYSQYLDTIFPDSKVKDIVYHGGTITKDEKFNASKSGIHFSTSLEKVNSGVKDETYPSFQNLITAILNIKNASTNAFEIHSDSFEKDIRRKEKLFPKDDKRIEIHRLQEQYQKEGKDRQEARKLAIEQVNKKIADNYYEDGQSPYDALIGLEKYKYSEDYILRPTKIGEYIIDSVGDINIAVKSPDQIHILGSKQDIQGFKDFVGNENNTSTPQLSTEPKSNLTKISNKIFNVPEISVVEEQKAVDMVFDPVMRRDRVSWLAQLFSDEVTRLVEERKELLQLRIDNNEEGKEELLVELESINRENTIRQYGPGRIFKNIKQLVFDGYVNTPFNDIVLAEFNNIHLDEMGNVINTEYSVEEKMEIAKETADYKFKEFSKLADPTIFKTLAEDASIILKETEYVIIDAEGFTQVDFETYVENSDGEYVNAADDVLDKEDTYRDGWTLDYTTISSEEGLSEEIRSMLRTIPKYGYDGQQELDDLGNPRFLELTFVYATLVDKLKNMLEIEDLFPLLEELERSRPWVGGIIERLKEDKSIESKFYRGLNKAFQNLYITKKKDNSDGTVTLQTIAINKPEGIYYLLENWRSNYEGGTLLHKDSVYKNNRDLNVENAKKGLKKVESINNNLNNLTNQQIQEIALKENSIEVMKELLNMVGIDIEPDLLRNTLANHTESDLIQVTPPILLMLSSLNVIFKGIVDKALPENASENIESKNDLVNFFESAYSSIASQIGVVNTEAVENNVHQKGKMRYAHLPHSFLSKLMLKLKDSVPNKKPKDPSKYKTSFEEFIYEEYGQFPFFKKNEVWLNDWIALLESNPEARKALEHMVMMDYDGVPYSKWGDLEYATVMHAAYYGDPTENTNFKLAWYPLPIVSDKPSGEFIRFRRYTNGDITDSNGKGLTYQEVITDKLTDVVIQEYNRILTVIKRSMEKMAGKEIDLIANYDRIIEDNVIKSMGGAEFKFFPALNNWRDNITGKDFLSTLREKKGLSDVEFHEFIKDTVRDLMEESFELEYAEMHEMGLFDENEIGQMMHLPYRGLKQFNGYTITNILAAKELLEANKTWTSDMEKVLELYQNNQPIRDKETSAVFGAMKEELNKLYENKTISKAEYDNFVNKLVVKNNSKDRVREQYWNTKLAFAMITQLTVTDYAYAKDMEDFQKRYAQVHSQVVRLNVTSEYGRENQKILILEDEEISSSIIREISEVLQRRVDDPSTNFSKLDKDRIVNMYRSVVTADALAFRSLSSYRAILDMMGEWGEDLKRAYDNIMTGKWDMRDFDVAFPIKKPFVFSQLKKDSQVGDGPMRIGHQYKNSEFLLLAIHLMVAGELGKSSKLKAINDFMEDNNIDVIQMESAVKQGKQGVINLNNLNVAGEMDVKGHKIKFNSFKELDGLLSRALEKKFITPEEFQELRGLYELNNYDAVYQTLAQSSGLYTVDRINLNPETKASILQRGENPNVVHTVSYRDYGILVETPEHYLDTELALGTQIRKLIAADIDPDAVLKIGNTTLNPIKNSKGLIVKTSKQQWLELYNGVITENIMDSFTTLGEKFSDPKEIEKLLHREIRASFNYDPELMRAATLDKDGKFALPLFDPVQSIKIQSLLSSVVKKHITKLKQKGGSLIQVSNYGLTDSLKVRFNNANNELIKNKEEFSEDYKGKNLEKDYEEYLNNNPSATIAYMEAYMPWYSKEYVSELLIEGSHMLDINKIKDKELLKVIGYRIPTEDKYSMIPIMIKGFLPQTSGGAIMLPADITTITGADFDVDKLYMLFPEFKTVNKFNIKQAWDDFYEANPDIVADIEQSKLVNFKRALQELLTNNPDIKESELDLDQLFKDFTKDIKNYEWVKDALKRFSQFFENNKSKYFISKKIEKVQYDPSKPIEDNTLLQRNNLILDLMWGVLTNADTAPRMLNPGGFELQRETAYRISIAEYYTELELRKELKVGPRESVYEVLEKMNSKQLKKFIEKKKPILDPLSIMTQIKLHQRNMTGAAMIGIYANHNSNHAIMQHTAVEFKNGVWLNNRNETSLHSIKNSKGEYISRNTGGYVAASVDNAKEPLLGDLNQNAFTADANMALIRSGYTVEEVSLFIKQPIIVEITKKYFRELKKGRKKEDIIEEVIALYKHKASEMGNTQITAFKDMRFLSKDLFTQIMIKKELDKTKSKDQTKDGDVLNYYNYQIAVAYNFLKLMENAEALGRLVAVTSADTSRGAAGPSFADTFLKIEKLDKFNEDATKPGFPILNAEVITNLSFKNVSKEKIRESLKKSVLPIIQAFQSMGLNSSIDFFKEHFPHFNNNVNTLIKGIISYTANLELDKKTLNSVYNDFLTFYLTKTNFFGTETITQIDPDTGKEIETVVSASEKRNIFLNNFPAEFEALLQKYPELKENDFVERLKIIKKNAKNPITHIAFKNAGKVSKSRSLKPRYSRAWTSLLYSNNPEFVKLALNLFRYSFFQTGLSFGPNTFAHFATVAIRTALPEYRDTLYELLGDTETVPEEFILQFIENHLDNRKIAPLVDEKASSINFYTSKESEGGMTLKDDVIFDVSLKTGYTDNKLIRGKEVYEDVTIYDFQPYFAINYRSGYAYYKLVLAEGENVNTEIAYYSRVIPKGLNGKYLEYEYGKDVNEINSLINQEDNVAAPIEVYDETSFDAAQYEAAYQSEYDSSKEYNYEESAQEESLQSQYIELLNMGGNYNLPSNDNIDLDKYAKNDMKDDNGDPICN